MKNFSKKNEIILFSAAILLLLIGSAVTLFTEQILVSFPTFLEEHVFHRTFNHEAYKDSMISLLSIPVFVSIIFSAILFPKFSDKFKSGIIISFIASVGIILFSISFTDAVNFVDPDLSSEILFSNECFREKTFWPLTWYYSMEIRLFNTQIVTAPLFFFTKDLRLIRAITVILCEAILFVSTYFILHELKIRKTWMKLLGCLLAISPVSWTFFCYVQEGSYYIPHIAFSFFYIGLFISLTYHSHSERKNKILFTLFIILSFISGLSSIRYILNFTFPLAAVVVYNRVKEFLDSKEKFSVKKFFLEGGISFRNSCIGLITSGIGYIFNSSVLASLYSFKNMNKIQFNPLSAMKIDRIISMILSTIGYNEDVSVFTPSGMANILIFILCIFTVIVFTSLFKANLQDHEKLFLQFTVFMAAFSLYTNICAEMVGRYLTMVFIYFVPFLALALQNEELKNANKWILGIASSVLIMTNAYLCFGKMQTTNRSENIQKVSNFLKENGYEFGFGFSNAANPIWFVTNGMVEVATIDDTTVQDTYTLPAKFKIHKWLSPKRFEDKNYYKGNKKVFFVIQKDEYNMTESKKVFEAGNLAYDDGTYLVFDYNSPESFRNSFN